MKETLVDIKKKLDEGLYKNEEHVRLSLVSRILKLLNWDIWEPQEVYSEFSPDKGRNKVDIALFTNSYDPLFIEIKGIGKLRNPNELACAEIQLRDYNVNLTALFTILTDGNYWRFYYSQEGGTFAQKCFKIIEIQKDDIEDVELAFLTFLSKGEIINGNAKKEAYEYLKLSRKQQIMEECISTAKRELENDPLITLVNSLCKVVNARGIEITEIEALEFLKSENSKKQPKIITTTKIIDDTSNPPPITITGNRKVYTLDNPYDLSFTNIISGVINRENANSWQSLLRIIVRHLLSKGISSNDIMKIATIKIQQGNVSGNGFHSIAQTDYSMQNVDANKVGRAIMSLATRYNINVSIQFRWSNKPGQAAFPNENCIMQN